MKKNQSTLVRDYGAYVDVRDFDCVRCTLRRRCDQAQEGTWCTRFTTRDPEEDRGEGPAEKWSRGEEDGAL